MKKHYEAIILSAVLACAAFTGCGTVENNDLPAADTPVTEAVSEEVTEVKITETETEAVTEAVPEETEPAVTEAVSIREANLAAIDGSYGFTSEDTTLIHTFSELFDSGSANASDSEEGLAMALFHSDSAAGSKYYASFYTTDYGKTWNNPGYLQITSGTTQFFALDNGDVLVFRCGGPAPDPEILIITQSASDPKPVISSNSMKLNEFGTEDKWDMPFDSFNAAYNGGTSLHVDYIDKNTDEIADSFDVDFGDFDFTFE